MAILNIKNEFLRVEITTLGAQLKSVKDTAGTEFMWNADPAFWDMSAPVIFPICGCLKDDKYTYDGKEYSMQGLGFAMQMDYSVREHSDDRVALYITDTEDTLKMYPFKFELEVVFTLKLNSIKVEYNVRNKGNGTMYFSLGCHEAYACPEGVEEYAVEFEDEVNLDTYLLDGLILNGKTMKISDGTKSLDIKEEYFELDSLCFKNLGTHSATLVHKNSNRRVRVEFPGFEYFLLWHEPLSKFLCLEPWKGFPDFTSHNYDFTKKEGIIALESNKESVSEHTIYFEN